MDFLKDIGLGIIRTFAEVFSLSANPQPQQIQNISCVEENYTLDRTVADIFNHVLFESGSRFEKLTVADCICVAPQIYRTEILIKEGVGNIEEYSNRDTGKLNKFYQIRRDEIWRQAKKMDYDFRVLYNSGAAQITLEQAQLKCDDFLQQNYFFLCAAIRFLTISRTDYDRYGKICNLTFKVGDFSELYQ